MRFAGLIAPGIDVGRIPASAWGASGLIAPPPGELYVLDWPFFDEDGGLRAGVNVQGNLHLRVGAPDGPPDGHGFLVLAQADAIQTRFTKKGRVQRYGARGRLADGWSKIAPRYRTWITKWSPTDTDDDGEEASEDDSEPSTDDDDLGSDLTVFGQPAARWVWRGCLGWLLRYVTAPDLPFRPLRPLAWQADGERAVADAFHRYGDQACQAETKPVPMGIRVAEAIIGRTIIGWSAGPRPTLWMKSPRWLASTTLDALLKVPPHERATIWKAYIRLLGARALDGRRVHMATGDFQADPRLLRLILQDDDMEELRWVIRGSGAPHRIPAALQYIDATRPKIPRGSLGWYARGAG